MSAKRKTISAMPVMRAVCPEAELRLKAKQFAARRKRYQQWFASQLKQATQNSTAI